MLTSLEVAEIVYKYMQEGIIVLNASKKIISANPKAEIILGYGSADIWGLSYDETFYQPSDLDDICTLLENGDEFWEGEVAKRRPNGEVYTAWLHIRKVEHLEKACRYVIVFRDMTKQKKAQKELVLAAKVFDNINEGVMVTDMQGKILSVNPAFQVVTGYTEEEVLGKTPNILQSGIHNKEFYNKLWTSLNNKGYWRGEIWNKRKNGEVFPEWLTISCVKNDKGKVINHVAVFTDITDQKLAEKELKKLAHNDSLTGMANRYSYIKRMETLLKTAKKYDQQLAVLFIDLDRFKQINDTFGHEAGDRLLIEVSGRLKELLKNKDMIARLGGDEFVMTLSNIKHPREAFVLAEKIIDVLSKPVWIEGHETYVSSSIGISFFPEDGMTVEQLLKNADKAMYEAKNHGRNRFAVYHDEMMNNASEKLSMEVELRKAIERNELFVVYQPQINLKNNHIEGVEALLRWKNEGLGMVSPADFIPLAEETGLIISIGEWVIEQVCKDLKTLEMMGFSNFKFAINISPLQFLQDEFVDHIMHILEKENVPARSIELELTESTIMPNAKTSTQRLVELKNQGFKISVDDFGTGYSSLSYLNRFPLDYLKIDQSFIKRIEKFEEDCSIVEAIITMAHRLHLKVIAEGVETERQLTFLQKEKCDIVQGYYFSKPVVLEELIDLLYIWETQWIK